MRETDQAGHEMLPSAGKHDWESLIERLDVAITAMALTDPSQLSPSELLTLYNRMRRSRDRLHAVASAVLGRIDETGATEEEFGISTGTWLSQQRGVNGWQAQRDLRHADQLTKHEHVRREACNGTIGTEQIAAITRTLSRLPDEFSNSQRTEAEAYLVGQASNLSPHQITHLIDDVIEMVDPSRTEQHAANRSARERKHAIRDRYAVIRRDGKGMTHIRAGIPDIEGARIQNVLDALGAEAHHRGMDSSTPYRSEGTLSQRRADALMLAFETVHADMNASIGWPAESPGGRSTPHRWPRSRARAQLRIAVTLEQLREALTNSHTVEGHALSPGDLRRLACDADILPAVMAGPSELLDLGRTTRTVPNHLRDALAYRDKGCTFPGCDVSEPYCEAHHILPWQEGGPTSLENLLLLCSHHHAMVEPPPKQSRKVASHQWQPQIGPDGVPEFMTPATHPEPRQIRRNSRFHNHPLRT